VQQKICREMQEEFWQNPTYVPLGMYDQPMAFHSYLQDVRDGWQGRGGRKKGVSSEPISEARNSRRAPRPWYPIASMSRNRLTKPSNSDRTHHER
jgi:hypothetical protein